MWLFIRLSKIHVNSRAPSSVCRLSVICVSCRIHKPDAIFSPFDKSLHKARRIVTGLSGFWTGENGREWEGYQTIFMKQINLWSKLVWFTRLAGVRPALQMFLSVSEWMSEWVRLPTFRIGQTVITLSLLVAAHSKLSAWTFIMSPGGVSLSEERSLAKRDNRNPKMSPQTIK